MPGSTQSTDHAKWWQYLICLAAIVYALVALLGTFVYFDVVCIAMLMVMAMGGTLASAWQLIVHFQGKLRLVAAAIVLPTLAVFVLWSAEGFWNILQMAFRQLFG